MFRNAMVIRSGPGLSGALEQVEGFLHGLSLRPSADPRAVAETRRLTGRLNTALCILKAALLRRESRGAHYRSDYPDLDGDQESPILIEHHADGIRARFAWEDQKCP